MNYRSLYDSIIAKHGSHVKHIFYCERHHIIPKCQGGSDDESNLTYVSARTHFILHKILCKIYTSPKLKFAYWAMCNQLSGDVKRDYNVTSRSFETAKLEFSKANSARHKGKTLSLKHIESIRSFMKGNTLNKRGTGSHLYGIERSDEVKSKISATKKQNPEKQHGFIGYWKTPAGIFSSSSEAAIANGCSSDVIRSYCKRPDHIVTKRNIASSKFFRPEDEGKLIRDLGWDLLQELP